MALAEACRRHPVDQVPCKEGAACAEEELPPLLVLQELSAIKDTKRQMKKRIMFNS